MATIKQVLELQIARIEEEVKEISSQIERDIALAREKYNAQLDERYANIKAARSMINLYDKHTKFLDTVSITGIPGPKPGA
jgi:hypothetical protein